MKAQTIIALFATLRAVTALPHGSLDATDKRDSTVDEISDALYGGWGLPSKRDAEKRDSTVDEISDALYGGWGLPSKRDKDAPQAAGK